MFTVKVIFQSGYSMYDDSFEGKEDADAFFAKYYPDGSARYEIVKE